MIVYVDVAGLYAALPGDVAVNTHVPAESAVITAPFNTHGPVSLSTTVAPDAADPVSTTDVPARTGIVPPTGHGAPPAGVTLT